MKKSITRAGALLPLAALAALASCSNDQDLAATQNPTDAITVGVSSLKQNQGRGTEATKESLKNGGSIALYAYATEDNFEDIALGDMQLTAINGNELKWTDGSVWSYGTPEYWSTYEGQKLHFFAYAPGLNAGTAAGVTNTNPDGPGLPSLKVTSPLKVADQKDLVWAFTKDQDKTKAAQTSGVKLQFKHAMCRVELCARLVKDGAYIKDEDAEAGTTAKINSFTLARVGSFVASAKYTWSKDGGELVGNWTDHEMSQEYEFDFNGALNIGSGESNVTVTNKQTSLMSVEKETVDGEETEKEIKQYMFLIPLAEGKTTTFGEATINYTVNTNSYGSHPNTDWDGEQVTSTSPIALEAGKAYRITYLIDVEKSAITMAPDIEVTGFIEFTEDGEGDYEKYDKNGGSAADIDSANADEAYSNSYMVGSDLWTSGFQIKFDDVNACLAAAHEIDGDIPQSLVGYEDLTAEVLSLDNNYSTASLLCKAAVKGSSSTQQSVKALSRGEGDESEGSGDGEERGGEPETETPAVAPDSRYIAVAFTGSYPSTGRNYMVCLKGTKEGGSEPEVIWSWHVWVTKYAPAGNKMQLNLGATYMGTIPTTKDGWNALVNNMDDYRQLYGLYYQFGRKDPFPSNKNASAVAGTKSIAEAVKNPTKFYTANGNWCSSDDNLWNGGEGDNLSYGENGKSIFDPCPDGWRVPAMDEKPWAAAKESNRVSWKIYGLAFDEQYYPAAGFLSSSNGALSNQGKVGDYWSASISSDASKAFYLNFFSSGFNASVQNHRAYGFSVRCVAD